MPAPSSRTVSIAANLSEPMREQIAAELALAGVERDPIGRSQYAIPGPFVVAVTLPDNATTVVDLTNFSNWRNARLLDAGINSTGEKVIGRFEAVELRIVTGANTESLLAKALREVRLHAKVGEVDIYHDIGLTGGTRFNHVAIATTASGSSIERVAHPSAPYAFPEHLAVDFENDTFEIDFRNAVDLAGSGGLEVELVFYGAIMQSRYARPALGSPIKDLGAALEAVKRRGGIAARAAASFGRFFGAGR